MSFLEIKDAILIGFFLSFMIGPVFFMLIQTSILKGFRAALVFDIGVILGDIVFILIAYYGSRSLLEEIKNDPRLFYLGGSILVIYGLVTYFNKKQETEVDPDLVLPEKTNYVSLIFKGFFLNFINVGVLAFWLGAIIIFGASLEMNSTKLFNFFLVVLLSYLITDIGKIVLAKQLKKQLTPKIVFKIKKGMGILLIVFGLALISKGFLPKNNLQNNPIINKIAPK